MGFLVAWRIVCSRASPGELKRTKRINQICYNQLAAPLKVWTYLYHARSPDRVKEIGAIPYMYNSVVGTRSDNYIRTVSIVANSSNQGFKGLPTKANLWVKSDV